MSRYCIKMLPEHCIKCYGTDIFTHYRQKGEDLDDTFGGDRKGQATEECLYKYCRNCQYWWVTPTADAEVSNIVKELLAPGVHIEEILKKRKK